MFDPVSYAMGAKAGGGGNPNYEEQITGTLANPLGDSNYTIPELVAMWNRNEITIYLSAEASAIGFGDFAAYVYGLYTGDERPYLYLNGISNAGLDVSTWQAFVYSLVSAGPDHALLLDGGSVTDLSDYLGLIPTTMTITHHPMP